MHTFKHFKPKLIQCVISVYCSTLYNLELVVDLTNRNNKPKIPILRNIFKSAHTTATKKVMAKNLRKTKGERIMNISPIYLYAKSQKLKYTSFFSFQLKPNPSLAAQEETQAPFLAVAASCTTTTKSSSLSLRMTNRRLTSFWYFFHRSFLGKGIRQNYRQCQSIKSCQQ